VTIRTVPATPIAVYDFTLEAEPNSTVYWDIVTYFLAQFPGLAASNVSAYTYLFPNISSGASGGSVATFEVVLALSNPASGNTLEEMWIPFWSYVNETYPNATVAKAKSIIFPNLYSLFLEYADSAGAGVDKVVGSRLLPSETLTDEAFSSALVNFLGDSGGRLYMVSGKGVWDAQPRGGSNAVNPAWRGALIHAGESRYLPLRPDIAVPRH
jgi:hypothetical protein